MCQGAIVAPIAIQDGSVLAFFPDRDGPIQPIGGGRVLLYHAPRDIGRSWTRKGRKFLTLNCRPESANSDVAAGDLLQIRGDTYEVTKVEALREGVLFIDLNRPVKFTASEARPAVTLVKNRVTARGYCITG